MRKYSINVGIIFYKFIFSKVNAISGAFRDSSLKTIKNFGSGLLASTYSGVVS